MMARETAEKLGYTPIARFVSFAVGGVPANVMGIGPIVAVPKALKKANLTLDDISVVELNEAFASQALACIKTLEIPMEKSKSKWRCHGPRSSIGCNRCFPYL